jgi:hypothetical protein
MTAAGLKRRRTTGLSGRAPRAVQPDRYADLNHVDTQEL